MPLTLDRIMELVRKHDAIVAKIAELDEQRAALEIERTAVKDELEGRPGRRAPAAGTVLKTVAAAKVNSTSSAPPSKSRRVEQELTELLPWLATIQSETSRKVVELRAGGKQPEAIAKELRLDQKAVANAIYRGRLQLRAARESGGKPKAAKASANDSEDGPGREPLCSADLPVALDALAPAGPTSDIVHLWSPDSGGTPTCGLAYDPTIRMITRAAGVTCSLCISADSAREPAAETPRPPEWVMGWLTPEVRGAYQQVVLDGISMQTVAWFENVKATVISGRVNGARSKVHRLLRWEADREREGVALTDKDREPPEKYSQSAEDPLLAILLGPGSSLGEVAPDSHDSEVDHVTTMSDAGADGRASATAGSGTADDAGAAMASKGTRYDVVARLEALRPWFPLLGPKSRELVELRCSGRSAAEIAEQLQRKATTVSAMLFDASASLRRHRDRLDGQPPGPDYNPKRGRARNGPSPAPPPLPTEWEPPVDPTGRRPGEIDPEADLSEFFPEEDETPAPTVPDSPTLAALAPPVPDVPVERVRGKTIANSPMGRTAWNRLNGTVGKHRSQVADDYPDVERPLSRGECRDMPRPCPFVSCSHHLFLDVNPETGSIKLNFPHLEVWEMAETCSLDVADRGGITLEEVGAILNLTRERIRQVEVRGLDKARDEAEDLEDIDGGDHWSPLARIQETG